MVSHPICERLTEREADHSIVRYLFAGVNHRLGVTLPVPTDRKHCYGEAMIGPDVFANALILTGPTASGKTALALELAQKLDAEIIVMDSMTLYRHMDIGTAKPTAEERSIVPHHLIDVLEPSESGSVAWWLESAATACRDIEARGKQPLFVGGTPLYLKSLLYGLFESPPGDAELRSRLEQEAIEQGQEAFHARLAQVDPVTAQRLHPNDVRRVVRALEVWELTGRPISAWQHQWTTPAPTETFPRCLMLEMPREELYDRINARVQAMLDAGWLDEARRLRELSPSRQALQSIGYQELFDVLDGRLLLDEALTLIQTRSRQFAKRQLTWFRHLSECRSCRRDLTSVVWQHKMKRTLGE